MMTREQRKDNLCGGGSGKQTVGEGGGEGGQMESADAYTIHGQPSLAGNSADGARHSLVITQP